VGGKLDPGSSMRAGVSQPGMTFQCSTLAPFQIFRVAVVPDIFSTECWKKMMLPILTS